MIVAGKMSKSLHHNYIGTEHLLIGLLKENSGVAAKILNENGVELDKIVDLIKELIAPAEGTAVAESDGYSPRAAKVLENAEKEAVRFHADDHWNRTYSDWIAAGERGTGMPGAGRS